MNIDTASAPGGAKRAAFYVRVTPFDPNPEPQLLELRKAAAERGYEVVAEFTDRVSGTQAKRPALDRLMADARRGQFDLLIVHSCDRIGRSTRHFLDLLDELRVAPYRFLRRPRRNRHQRTAGQRHRAAHRRPCRSGAELDQRASARRYAACAPRRPT